MENLRLRFMSTVIVTGLLLSACVKTVNHSSTTHVRDLVESDVFTVLPENGTDITIYHNLEDVAGEYLELAAVSVVVEGSGDKASEKDRLLAKLKRETQLLGGNAFLLKKETSEEEGQITTTTIKGIAIYKLEEIPKEMEETYAALPI